MCGRFEAAILERPATFQGDQPPMGGRTATAALARSSAAARRGRLRDCFLDHHRGLNQIEVDERVSRYVRSFGVSDEWHLVLRKAGRVQFCR